MKNILNKKTRIPWAAILIILAALVALVIATVAQIKSNQAKETVALDVRFQGEYRIDGGEWKSISKTKHISATDGIVELKGSFILYDAKSGEELGAAESTEDGDTTVSLYLDHIKATITNSKGSTLEFENENDLYGKGVCIATWIEYTFEKDAGQEVLITLYNPHVFGNSKAVDSLLESVSIYNPTAKSGIFSSFEPLPLTIGLLLAVFLLVLFAAALFATLLHQKSSGQIWLLWLLVFFGGVYFIFSRDKIGIWNPMYAANTVMLGSSIMIYVLTAFSIISSFLKGLLRKIAIWATVADGLVTLALMVLSVVSPIDFYDTYLYWTIVSVCVAVLLIVFTVISMVRNKKDAKNNKIKYVFISSIVVLASFIVDVIATVCGIWQGGKASLFVLLVIVVASFVIICRVVPRSVKTILVAKSIEAEKQAMEVKLQESQISIMLSQIQPHFLYNTLNSIYHLCETNPMLAKSMVNSFSEYLRNNLSSIEETGLISFETELAHIKTYLEIEKVRFEDTLEIEYDIKCVEFSLPVLTVQPMVENAVKHGTSKKRGGGKVFISTYEDKESYVIKVSDTGCGFDPSQKKDDGKRHIGIENVRQRLSNMCGGSLTIESEIGEGTLATIRIPKGDKK